MSAVTRVLVVSASGRPADVLAAIRSGANGYDPARRRRRQQGQGQGQNQGV
jgi:DNA-binding NarL/FixJ family response regulator